MESTEQRVPRAYLDIFIGKTTDRFEIVSMKEAFQKNTVEIDPEKIKGINAFVRMQAETILTIQDQGTIAVSQKAPAGTFFRIARWKLFFPNHHLLRDFIRDIFDHIETTRIEGEQWITLIDVDEGLGIVLAFENLHTLKSFAASTLEQYTNHPSAVTLKEATQ